MQEKRNSIALAMELIVSCTNPSISGSRELGYDSVYIDWFSLSALYYLVVNMLTHWPPGNVLMIFFIVKHRLVIDIFRLFLWNCRVLNGIKPSQSVVKLLSGE